MPTLTNAEKADAVAALDAANDAQADATQALADAATAQATAAAKLAPGGNLTGQVAGAAAATVASGAAAGATALQPGGNLTGQVDGAAAATVKSGAAAGATALQPAGNLTGQVGGVAVATVTAGAAAGATALQPAGTLTGAVAATATIDGTVASSVKAGAALGASAVQPARTITAGAGLSGGGSLAADRTVSLALGTNGQILKMVGGAPTWVDPMSIEYTRTAETVGTTPVSLTAGGTTIQTRSGAGIRWLKIDTSNVAAGDQFKIHVHESARAGGTVRKDPIWTVEAGLGILFLGPFPLSDAWDFSAEQVTGPSPRAFDVEVLVEN